MEISKDKEQKKQPSIFLLPFTLSFLLHILGFVIVVVTSFVSHGGKSATPELALVVVTPVLKIMNLVGYILGEKVAGDLAGGIFILSFCISFVLWAFLIFLASIPVWMFYFRRKSREK